MLIGYSLWNHTGKQLWSRDAEIKDHADGAVMGNFSGDPKGEIRIYTSGSDEGFMMFDRDGGWLKHVHIGHEQSPCVGKFREDIPGLQYFTVNCWRNPGIVTLFDYQGNLLEQDEPIHSGSVMLPVNWRGDGQEFVLLTGNSKEGGMIGHSRVNESMRPCVIGTTTIQIIALPFLCLPGSSGPETPYRSSSSMSTASGAKTLCRS